MRYTFTVSMLEIYNEDIIDLLNGGRGGTADEKGKKSKATKLAIRQRSNGELYVDGLVDVNVESIEDVAKVMDLGNRNRSVGSHNINEHSSRSHLVFTCKIEGRSRTKVIRSELNLIDLAGSERLSKTGANGERGYSVKMRFFTVAVGKWLTSTSM